MTSDLNRNVNYHREKKIRRKGKFQKGDLLLARVSRVSKIGDKICTRLILPLEGPFINVSDQNISSYVLGYFDSEKVEGIFHINDFLEFKKQK